MVTLIIEAVVFNTAKSGATIVSFLKDGSWDISVTHIKEVAKNHTANIITIQIGHNDRHCSSGSVMRRDLTLNMVKELGAEPVPVAPLAIRDFTANGRTHDGLVP
ncbi:carbohydrate esterase family 12 protein [Moniliophthora roreri]|nr:carbohydrate esterase family 12 protein [Moniliophthora roreri]